MMRNLLRKSSFILLCIVACFCHVSFADDANSKFDCTLTDQLAADKTPGDAKDTFSKDTAVIYLVCDSDAVTKGQIVKGVWIAADTNNVAPANYKIDEKSLPVGDITNDQTFTANFSLSKPTNGWPLGSYHVDLYVDNKMIQSIPFTVK